MTSTSARPSERQRLDDMVGAVLAMGTFALLCIVVPVWVAAITPDPAFSAWHYTILIMLWSGARLTALVYRGKPYLYSVIVWVFVYVFLGMAATLQMRGGQLPNTTPTIFQSTFEPAAEIVIVGLAAFEVGLWLGRRRSGARTTRVLSPQRVKIFAWFSLALAGAVAVRTGLEKYVGERDALTTARQGVWGTGSLGIVLLAAAIVFPLVAVHSVYRLRQAERGAGRRAPLAVTGVLLLATVLFTVNPLTSARITFGTTLLSLAVLAGALATAARVRVTIVALLAGLVLVFPAADLGRGRSSDGLGALATSGDYDAFVQIANSVQYVHIQGITWGHQLLGSVFFWVPRSVWQDKPIDTGVLIAAFRGYNFQNLSAPLWAEGYINLGWVGVIGLLGLLGFLARRGDLALEASLGGTGLGVVAGAVLPFFLIIILRGSLLQAMGELVAYLLAFLLVSRREKSTAGDTVADVDVVKEPA